MKEYFLETLSELGEIAEVARIAKHIDGWLSETEGAALYHVARHGSGEGCIVEIGSFKGKSTVWLAGGTKLSKREQVYAIDTHLGSEEHRPGGEFASHMPPEGTTFNVFQENIARARLNDWVVPLVMTSNEALKSWSKPIRLLFIDGDHSYKGVKQDFFGWHTHVVPGGVIAIHDINVWDGPTVFVNRILSKSKKFSRIGLVKSLALFIKL